MQRTWWPEAVRYYHCHWTLFKLGVYTYWASVQNWFAFWPCWPDFGPLVAIKWLKMVVSNHYLKKYSRNPIQTWCVQLFTIIRESPSWSSLLPASHQNEAIRTKQWVFPGLRDWSLYAALHESLAEKLKIWCSIAFLQNHICTKVESKDSTSYWMTWGSY